MSEIRKSEKKRPVGWQDCDTRWIRAVGGFRLIVEKPTRKGSIVTAAIYRITANESARGSISGESEEIRASLRSVGCKPGSARETHQTQTVRLVVDWTCRTVREGKKWADRAAVRLNAGRNLASRTRTPRIASK